MKRRANNYSLTKFACYTSYFTMSSVFSLPPLLFVTLHNMYGISYTLLGTLVLTNFCTQLAIDLVFTFFAKYFNVAKTVRVMPLITSAGLFIYAFSPFIFPNAVYAGLLIGTVIFSVSAGLSEVLLSPTIAAIPSDDPQRAMSLLHSLYAFGVVSTVLISTLYFKFFGSEKWYYLAMIFAALPVAASVMFMLSQFPEMNTQPDKAAAKKAENKLPIQILCLACIFFGCCAENAMSNWISSFLENALGINKTTGDILGVAMFAVLLGMGRLSYSKFGKNIGRVLFISMTGAAVCYLSAGLFPFAVPAFIACALTGLAAAMLWPGSLIMMEDCLPGAGVAAYAMMAAGGDLGASVAPQLLGIIIDKVSASNIALSLSASTGFSPEQIGLKAGMVVSAAFPILGAVTVAVLIKKSRMQKSASANS